RHAVSGNGRTSVRLRAKGLTCPLSCRTLCSSPNLPWAGPRPQARPRRRAPRRPARWPRRPGPPARRRRRRQRQGLRRSGHPPPPPGAVDAATSAAAAPGAAAIGPSAADLAGAPAMEFAHFIAQSDMVGKSLFVILVLMSLVTWYLIVVKAISNIRTRARS